MNPEQFLRDHDIAYVRHDHPAVYTCEDAEKYCGNIPGMACKNLLLRGKKGARLFLVIMPANKRMDLKKFGEAVGENKISFASDDVLMEKLGLEPGSVSPFGLLNPAAHDVELYIDAEVYNADIVGFHPNANIATLEISREMFRKFLNVINREPHILE